MLVACGGNDKPTPGTDGGTGSGSGTGPIAIDDFAAAYIHAYCTKEAQCCSSTVEATCEMNLLPTEKWAIEDEKQFITANQIGYNAVAAGQCIDVVDALACSDVGMLLGAPGACALVFTPLVANGGQCKDGRECVSNNCYDADDPDDGDPGTCMPSDTIGDTCSFDCTNGLYCDQNMEMCVPLKANGAACTDEFECTGGACTSNVCATAAPITCS